MNVIGQAERNGNDISPTKKQRSLLDMLRGKKYVSSPTMKLDLRRLLGSRVSSREVVSFQGERGLIS